MFDAGPYIDVVKALLNPAPIYTAMSYFTGLSSLILFFFPLFVAVRLATEASKLGLKSTIGEAFGDFASTPVRFMMYTVGGFIMFLILFGLQGFFENLGGTGSIEKSLSDFRSRIVASREQQEDWIYTVLKFASDVGNTATVPLFFIIYQVASCIYIFVKHLMQVIFALLVVMTYAYGFVAILTQALPKQLNLTPGFIKSFLTLAIWVVIEPIALGLVNLLQRPGQDALVNMYGGGLGTTAMNAWFLYTSILLTTCILVLVAVPFIARALAQGDAMAGPLAAGSAALTALLMNEGLRQGGDSMKSNGGAMMDSVMPSADGSRRRDTGYQSVADTASSIFQSDMISGARNLLSAGLGDTTMTSQNSSPQESRPTGPSELGASAQNTSQSTGAPPSGQDQSLGDVRSSIATNPMTNATPGEASSSSAMGDATSRAENFSSADQQGDNAAEIYDSAQHDYSVGDATQADGITEGSSESDDPKSKSLAQPILDMLDEPPPSVNPDSAGDMATTTDHAPSPTPTNTNELINTESHGGTKKTVKPPMQGLGDLGNNSHDDGRS